MTTRQPITEIDNFTPMLIFSKLSEQIKPETDLFFALAILQQPERRQNTIFIDVESNFSEGFEAAIYESESDKIKFAEFKTIQDLSKKIRSLFFQFLK